MNNKRITIAGCGIGGLATAIGLARDCHDVSVLERSGKVRSVGAGISLQPNAMQALEVLGLADAVKGLGCESVSAKLRHSNGRVLKSLDFSSYVEQYGHLPMTIHRSDLLNVLLKSAVAEGVQIHFGEPLAAFEVVENSVSVRSESGRVFVGDLLIGADGINSRVRVQLFGDEPKRYSGYVCWRGSVTAPAAVEAVDEMNEIWCKGSRFGYMRCSPNRVYWFATLSTDKPEPPNHWQQTFDGWPTPVRLLIESTPTDQVRFNDISDRPACSSWSSGPVTLLGDAAHPMTPNFGQGGAQAIEDAVVLSRSIARNPDPTSAYRQYEQLRSPRTKFFVDGSFRFGRITQGGSWPARLIRNHVVPALPRFIMERNLRKQFDFRSHLGLLSTG